MVLPDGLTTMEAVRDWHEANDRKWDENPPAMNPAFVDKWFLRTQDLVDRYRPDLLYFDNAGLPLGQAGLDIAAHFYNANRSWHEGRLEAVLNSKGLPEERRGALVEDIERGVAEGIRPAPWQTDTCIGSWHYDRRLYEQHKYKTVGQVVRMLADIVSKNGNLLLSIPVRGDGTIDEDEVAFLKGLAAWMDVNGEAIFGTRPWAVYGEGPSVTEKPETGEFGGARDVRSKPYTAEDVRFTVKGDAVYALVMEWPADRKILVKSLAAGTPAQPALLAKEIASVRVLGAGQDVEWSRDGRGLHVTLPPSRPGSEAFALKVVTR
jgi:alpha-L-fucosidase